jgi:hypothetical protein
MDKTLDYPIEEYRPGRRCEIVKVGHPAWAKEIGKKVIIVSVNPAFKSVWAHDDQPPRTRVNKLGRTVNVYNPKSVNTVYGMNQLKPLGPAEPGASN